jgi:hypothetical protein
MKPSQKSLFKADAYVRVVAENGILGLVHRLSEIRGLVDHSTGLVFEKRPSNREKWQYNPSFRKYTRSFS